LPSAFFSKSKPASKGILINGNPVKLKGGCLHHDNGPLGTSDLERANERKISILKANGFNAVRCSHNPPSQSFLDICDRLGMLVIDEAFDMWNR
jgi:beta-galactosidase